MSRRRTSIEPPASLPPTHPDYAGRERYNTSTAGAYLGLHRALVNRLAAEGKIGHRLSGRERLFSQADLDAYRQACRREAAPLEKARAVRLTPQPTVTTTAALQMPAKRRFS